MAFTVYMMRNKISGRVYIGATTRSLETRYRGKSWHHCAKNKDLRNDIINIGQENFELKELCSCSSKEEMDNKETEFILKFESRDPEKGYNVYTGGIKGSRAGEKHISRILDNLGDNKRVGWKHMWDNPVYREKLSRSISLCKKGKAPNLSPESKERQREAARRNGLANKGRKRIFRVNNITT